MVASASSSNTQCPSDRCSSTSALVARAIAPSSAGSGAAGADREGMVSVISFMMGVSLDPCDDVPWLRAGHDRLPPPLWGGDGEGGTCLILRTRHPPPGPRPARAGRPPPTRVQ